MAEDKGKDARLYIVAGAGTPVTLIGKAHEAEWSRTPVQATHVSYDSGASVPRKVIRYDGPLSFKMFTDRADAGQNIVRAAVHPTAPTQVTVDLAPNGNASGQPYERFLANVTIKKGHPVDGMAVTDVTLDPDGAITEGTYA